MGEGFWVRKHSKVSARHKKGSSDEALRAPKEQSTRGNVKYQTVQRWYSAAKDRDETQTGTGRAKSSLKYKIRIHNRSVRPKKQSNVGGSPTGHWDGFIIVRHLPDWVYKSSGNRMNQESSIDAPLLGGVDRERSLLCTRTGTWVRKPLCLVWIILYSYRRKNLVQVCTNVLFRIIGLFSRNTISTTGNTVCVHGKTPNNIIIPNHWRQHCIYNDVIVRSWFYSHYSTWTWPASDASPLKSIFRVFDNTGTIAHRVDKPLLACTFRKIVDYCVKHQWRLWLLAIECRSRLRLLVPTCARTSSKNGWPLNTNRVSDSLSIE